jgi:hypothetical protein
MYKSMLERPVRRPVDGCRIESIGEIDDLRSIEHEPGVANRSVGSCYHDFQYALPSSVRGAFRFLFPLFQPTAISAVVYHPIACAAITTDNWPRGSAPPCSNCL